MSATRAPSVAGSFYPADPAVLADAVDALLAGPATDGPRPAALVVPHAGYPCSGAVAASGYRRLVGHRVATVAVLGPAHFRDPGGLAVPASSAWRTPLGDVPVDQEVCQQLVDLGLAHRDDRPHAGEHSVEVQLPFLQRVLGDGWACVPALAHAVDPEAVADCIGALARDGVQVVVSTDLSHYHDRSTAEQLDRRTVDAVLAGREEAIGDRDACGAVVLRGLLVWLRRRGLGLELIAQATSADTCGGPERVVGYATFASAVSSVGDLPV